MRVCNSAGIRFVLSQQPETHTNLYGFLTASLAGTQAEGKEINLSFPRHPFSGMLPRVGRTGFYAKSEGCCPRAALI